MKRKEFFRNIAAVITGLVVAPKFLKAATEEGKSVFNTRVLHERLNHLHKYPLTEKDVFWLPKPLVIRPYRIEPGKSGQHVLVCSYPTVPVRSLNILIDERGMKYWVVDASHEASDYRITISEWDKNQLKRGRSRRRGLIPRIGKEYIVIAARHQEA